MSIQARRLREVDPSSCLFITMKTSNIFPKDKVFSVTEISTLIKSVLEGTFSTVIVAGELTNWRVSPSGHVYFALKDDNALIKCIMWRSTASFLNFTPRDGDAIKVTGRLTTYIAQGAYQIVVDKITKMGTGDILERLEILKKKLAAEGLFNSAHKRAIPPSPRAIGVVTSPTGAAIEDIKRVVFQRNPFVKIILFPALVQGADAPKSIISAIDAANSYFYRDTLKVGERDGDKGFANGTMQDAFDKKPLPLDVLIVGRGGGSIEDLLPFSDEAVVRAVYNSKIPVISAVGHEIDWALCDYAADARAATPSNAAEIATTALSDILAALDFQKESLFDAVRSKIALWKNIIDIKGFCKRSELSIRLKEQQLSSRFDSLQERLALSIRQKITTYQNTLKNIETAFNASNPLKVLDRGYAVLKNTATGAYITSVKQIATGDAITATLKDGEVQTVVKKV